MSSDEESDEEDYWIYAGAEREILGAVTDVHIEDEVRKIEKQAFYGCTHLRTVSFNNRLEVIGVNAFCRCRSLRSINIPCAIRARALNDGAFKDCWGLLAADLGGGL